MFPRTILLLLLSSATLFCSDARQAVEKARKDIDAYLTIDLRKISDKDRNDYDVKGIELYLQYRSALDTYTKTLTADLKTEMSDSARELVQAQIDSNTAEASKVPQLIVTFKNRTLDPTTEKAIESNETAVKSDALLKNTAYTRAVVGVTLNGSTIETASQKIEAEFMLNAPLGPFGPWRQLFPKNQCAEHPYTQDCAKYAFDDPLQYPVWAFFNPKITSVPQSGTIPISGVNANGSFLASVSQGKLTDIVQAFEMEQGLEYALLKPRRAMQLPGSDENDPTQRLGIYAFSSFGVGSALNPQDHTAIIYRVNPTLTGRYPDIPTTAQYVAFISRERDHFYKNYYMGLRLKTYNFHSDLSKRADTITADFPGIFDVSYGQDESNNGGRLHGGVVRLQTSYPFKWVPGVHLFGDVKLSLNKAKDMPALILTSAGGDIKPTDPNVFIENLSPISRDSYRIGLGIDLVEAIKHWSSDKKKQSEADQAAKDKPSPDSSKAKS